MTKIERYESMVARFPQSEVPRYSLACAYREAGRIEDALTEFAEIMRIKPDFMMAWVHTTELLVGLERYDEARPICTAAIALAKAQDHSGPLMDCETLLDEIESELR